MVNLDELAKAITEGDSDKAESLVRQALSEKQPAADILNKGLIPGLQKVGDKFEAGEFFLPELIVSGDAVAKALELLEPVLTEQKTAHAGKFLIGTVQGDVHNLGKNIVTMMLRGNGWEVTDLGVDISPEEFCQAVKDGNYDVLGISSLLTMTMPNTARTIQMLKEKGLDKKVKVIVGGAPTSKEWADSIGADGYAKDGPSAARVAAELLKK